MGRAEKIRMTRRSSCLNLLLCLTVVMCFFSHTAIAAMKCKSGETFASTGTLVCLTCNPQCASACPKGSTVTKTNCVPIRFLDTPLCECCCKMPPPPPPPSPPPPSPPPPPPSPPPPSPPPPPPSPPPPSPPPPPPSPSPPPPSPPPPSPSPPPAPSCPQVCPSEFEFQSSPDQPPCTYKLASQIMIM
ncbi:hypothetical protein C5167_002538 [Papaver somniferum]|uniref:Uncharacterized protein n=1 Tax=Papaver somniferum TaxID=3469 RepID=A0A4Y7L2D9_PAPSO|nr:leucine-rich repeat extensin-like protein 6 [Papaver somniferum]RZC78365.1 hypothetical protein C5167_002538 [Papaver somniferum]